MYVRVQGLDLAMARPLTYTCVCLCVCAGLQRARRRPPRRRADPTRRPRGHPPPPSPSPTPNQVVQRGIFSSLQPANLRLKRAVSNEAAALSHPAYPLLFDPQTAGGLLSTVPAASAPACVAELRRLGYEAATVVGHVTEVLPEGAACALTLVDILLDSKD